MSANVYDVSLGGVKFKLIDLSQPLKEDTQGYPGDPILKKEVFCEIEKGWQHHIYSLGDHMSQPHADAPKHQNPDMQDKGLEFFNKPEYTFNSACMIDLSKTPEAKKIGGIQYLIEVEEKHLKPYSKILSDKGAVLIRTGYDNHLEANKPHEPKNLPFLKALFNKSWNESAISKQRRKSNVKTTF